MCASWKSPETVIFGIGGGDLLSIDISNEDIPTVIHLRDSNGFQAFFSGIVGNSNPDGYNTIAVEAIDMEFGYVGSKQSLAVAINSSGTMRLWNVTTGQIISTTSTSQFYPFLKSGYIDGT